jgi:hypothetical protein
MISIKSEWQNIRRYVPELARWLFSEPRRVWLTLAAIGLVCGIAVFLPICGETALRWSGMLIELLGIGTVVIGLRSKQLLFKRRGVLGHLADWLKRRPQYNPKPQVIQLQGASSVAVVGAAKASVWRGVPQGSPLEQRVTALEQNLETVRREQRQLENELAVEVRNSQQALAAESQARMVEDGNLKKQVEELGAGGLHLEIMGIVWLVAGVILATVSSDLAPFISVPTPRCPNG